MRQLMIQTSAGHGQRVLEAAKNRHGANMALVQVQGDGGQRDMVYASVTNDMVGPLISDLAELPELRVNILPVNTIAMRPPATELAEQIVDMHRRSPIEVWLNGLQSIGSWGSLLSYTLAGSIVVWIGLYTNSIYLLIAAMLISPFAGPAMNVAIATARGDWKLLRQGLARYVASLSVAILASAALSFLLGQKTATTSMVDLSFVSSVTALLPLVSGVAGALNLVQPDKSSLVSGTAVGILVAASLAPPAGLTGMSLALGDWDMAKTGAFVLSLQLVGINLGGTLVFRWAGLTPGGIRYERGHPRVLQLSIAISGIILAGLLAWQFLTPLEFQHSSMAQRAVGDIQEILKGSDEMILVQAGARFTRPSVAKQNTLLADVYVQALSGSATSGADRDRLKGDATRMIQQGLLERGYPVTPLVHVVILDPP